MTHLLIIWGNGLFYRSSIIEDIELHFQLYARFIVKWDENKFEDNLCTFYSRSWSQYPKDKLIRALKDKKDYCGTNPFELVVFVDNQPNMDWRNTSNGKFFVNTNVFDKKCEYRTMTGGGHLIHASNDEEETNRDLTLLLGLNLEDFYKKYPQPICNVVEWGNNCVGVGGYDSLIEFFYVLNNTIKYCVLRNHESLPVEYLTEKHGDIDLLVENKQQMVCLTLAHPVFVESYRVHHTIQITGNDIPFDFRYVGDDYYDKAWEKHILSHRKLKRNMFYVPDDEDQYFSLLYHAYIQKKEVSPDYNYKLYSYAKVCGYDYKQEPTFSIRQLDVFMRDSGYEYIAPKDKSVFYNYNHLNLSINAYHEGVCIKRTDEDGSNGFVYSTRIYQKDHTFVKVGTDWLLKNEAVFLEKLKAYDFFPRIVSYQSVDYEKSRLELTKINGVDFNSFFDDVNHQKVSFIRSFLKQIIAILRIFQREGISHRDLMPSNIIVDLQNNHLHVSVIDFGWAADNNGIVEAKTPADLGGRYALNNKPSDYYALGLLLMDYWSDVPYVRLAASLLFSASNGNQEKQLLYLERLLFLPFSPYDYFRLFLRRHRHLVSLVKNFIQ